MLGSGTTLHPCHPHLVKQGVAEPLVLSPQQRRPVARVYPAGRNSGGRALVMGRVAGAPSPTAAPARRSAEAPRLGAPRSQGCRRLPPQEGAAIGGAPRAPGRNDAQGLHGEFSDGLGCPLHRRAPQAGEGDSGEGGLHRITLLRPSPFLFHLNLFFRSFAGAAGVPNRPAHGPRGCG